MQKDLEMNSKEFTILNLLHVNYDQKEDMWHQFPKVYGGGEFVLNSEQNDHDREQIDANHDRYSFIVMQKLGKTLNEYMEDNNGVFSLKTVCQVGI